MAGLDASRVPGSTCTSAAVTTSSIPVKDPLRDAGDRTAQPVQRRRSGFPLRDRATGRGGSAGKRVAHSGSLGDTAGLTGKREPSRGRTRRAEARHTLRTMTPLPGRLVAFMAFGVLAGAFILYRGLNAEGEPRVVFTVLGALALGGVLLILLGWWRQSKRR